MEVCTNMKVSYPDSVYENPELSAVERFHQEMSLLTRKQRRVLKKLTIASLERKRVDDLRQGKLHV